LSKDDNTAPYPRAACQRQRLSNRKITVGGKEPDQPRQPHHAAFLIGQKPVGLDVIDAVLPKDIDSFEPRLTRHGYNVKAFGAHRSWSAFIDTTSKHLMPQQKLS